VISVAYPEPSELDSHDSLYKQARFFYDQYERAKKNHEETKTKLAAAEQVNMCAELAHRNNRELLARNAELKKENARFKDAMEHFSCPVCGWDEHEFNEDMRQRENPSSGEVKMLRCQIDNCDERGTAETNLPIGDTSLMARGVWVCSKHYEILIAKSKPSGGEESGSGIKTDGGNRLGLPKSEPGRPASKPPEGKPRKCNTCPHTNKPIYEVPCRRCKTRTNDETDKDEWRQDPNKPDQGYIEGRISPD
jgi:hypothetical protein